MKVFCDEEFLNFMEYNRKKAWINKDHKIINQISKVDNLLNFAQVVLTKEQIKNLIQKIENRESLTPAERINIRLFFAGDQNAQNSQKNKLQYSAYFFKGDTNSEKDFGAEGIICKDKNWNFEDFFSNSTVANFPISGYDYGKFYNEYKLPINAMIIYDPYIFDYPRKVKLYNLIAFIKNVKTGCNGEFHLTIITKNGAKNKKENETIEECINEIKRIGDIKVEVVISNKHRDRTVLTNYSTMSFGHPFEKNSTKFSQNFLGNKESSERIRLDYVNYWKELEDFSSIIEDQKKRTRNASIPDNPLTYYGPPQENFRNRIFDILIEE